MNGGRRTIPQATTFAVDEPLERLGESLSLPPSLAHLRAELERVLTPLPNPRAARAT